MVMIMPSSFNHQSSGVAGVVPVLVKSPLTSRFGEEFVSHSCHCSRIGKWVSAHAGMELEISLIVLGPQPNGSFSLVISAWSMATLLLWSPVEFTRLVLVAKSVALFTKTARNWVSASSRSEERRVVKDVIGRW